MNKGGSQKLGDVTVTMTHAVHSCGILDDGKIVYGGEAAGYVMRFADGRTLYFSGDTNVFSDMAADRAALPAGAGVSADRRPVHDEPARSGAGLPAAEAEEGHPDAFRHVPAADWAAGGAAGSDRGHGDRSVGARARQNGRVVIRVQRETIQNAATMAMASSSSAMGRSFPPVAFTRRLRNS